MGETKIEICNKEQEQEEMKEEGKRRTKHVCG